MGAFGWKEASPSLGHLAELQIKEGQEVKRSRKLGK